MTCNESHPIDDCKIVALLPMKAHSERVKGKNFRDFNGKPLFKWVLDVLLSVESIDKVVINTDAKDILADKGVIENDKLIIRERKKELCGDMVSMNSIIQDDINAVASDIYLMTHTTNPLLKGSTIEKTIDIMKSLSFEGINDSIFSVNKIQTRFYDDIGVPVNHDPKELKRTQDLVPWYEENSCLYLFTKDSFVSTNARIGNKPKLFEMSKYESIDIDTEEDWGFALIASNYYNDQL